MELTLKLNDELELVDISKGELDLNYISHYSSNERILKIAFASAQAVHDEGVLAILKVKAATPVFSKRTLSIDVVQATGNSTSVEALAKPAQIGLSSALEMEMGTAYKVYPNPASEFVDVTVSPSYEGPVDIEMTDASGKAMAQRSFNKAKGFVTHRVNFRAEKGLYLLKIKTAEGTKTSKVVVGE